MNLEIFFRKGRGSYGGDTMLMLEYAKHCNKIAWHNELLHNYYLHPKSVTYSYVEPKQIYGDVFYYEAICDFLNSVGNVPKDTNEYVKGVFIASVARTIEKTLTYKCVSENRIEILLEIFSNEKLLKICNELSIQSLNANVSPKQKEIYINALSFVLSKKENLTEENLNIVAAVFAAIKTLPENLNNRSNAETFKLLTKIKEKSKSAVFNHRLNNEIVSVASQQAFLAGVSAAFLVFFSDIVIAVLEKNFSEALELIAVIIEEDRGILSGSGLPLVTLGLNLSAELNKMNYFVFFKKMQISLLIDSEQIEKAAAEISEWLEKMPNDEDFIELGERIKQ
jgi:hypothetical protein